MTKSTRPDGNDRLLGEEDRHPRGVISDDRTQYVLGDPPRGRDGLKRPAPSPQDDFYGAAADMCRAIERLAERLHEQLEQEEDKRS